MAVNSEALTLALSRRLAIADGRNQQQAMIQCAARLLEGASPTIKHTVIQFIATTPSERQAAVAVTERMFINA